MAKKHGLVGDRIIGGRTADISEFPYQLQVLYGYQIYPWAPNLLAFYLLCGASIIRENRAICAAHCVYQHEHEPQKFLIQAGSTSSDGDSNSTQLRLLSYIKRHDLYDPYTIDNDISMMYWEENLIFDAFTAAVALPKRGDPFPYGKYCNVTGYGLTENGGDSSDLARELQDVEVPIYPTDICESNYPGLITENMFCAGVPNGGKDSCNGDSGGPLTTDNTQWGIVSWGAGCGVPNRAGVYTKIPNYLDWIDEHINDSNTDASANE